MKDLQNVDKTKEVEIKEEKKVGAKEFRDSLRYSCNSQGLKISDKDIQTVLNSLRNTIVEFGIQGKSIQIRDLFTVNVLEVEEKVKKCFGQDKIIPKHKTISIKLASTIKKDINIQE